MKRTKNSVRIALMGSSVLLLMALQFFWLKSSYEKAYFDFRRESSMLFRNTVFSLRDSLFVRNIETLPLDSAEKHRMRFLRRDSFNVRPRSVDSVKAGSKMQIYVSSEVVDSSADFLKPLASSLHQLEPRRSFIIRMGPDTLSMDTLTLRFKRSLDLGGIEQPFRVQLIREHEPFRKGLGFTRVFGNADQQRHSNPFSDTLVTEQINLNPLNAYVAVFTKVSYAIIKEITPQILFSLALTTAITASFIVMYRSLRSQQRLNDMKNDFISNVTHELKTPVATVSVALEALKDFDVLDNPARSKEYLSIAQEELNRLTLMTDKILKAAVYENQGITFTTEKVNLVVVVGKVLSSLKVVFEKHNLQVRYLPEGSDFEIEGSTMHLTNVVYNLIDNAIKYGSDNSTIDVVLRDSNDKIELAVQDKGIGIATEYHKKIFEKFFRIPTGDVHDVKGYGLGLNYVFEVVKKHHGKIDVVSEPAKGSVFTVRLPKRVH
jgi:two-component system, OmpR family, phosphate regulon sensor histidine kinase PhoR